MLPLFAYGHGGEFLEARLDHAGGVLKLSLVAEYGDNPMIADEAEARKVLADTLRIRVGTSLEALLLSELAPLELAPREAREPESPMPPSVPDPAHAHRLLGATWSWSAPEGEVSFVVPETCRQTVLFWLHTPGVSPPRWTMLVPGDQTPAIAVEHPWWRSAWVWAGLPVVGVGGGLMLIRTWRRRRSTLS